MIHGLGHGTDMPLLKDDSVLPFCYQGIGSEPFVSVRELCCSSFELHSVHRGIRSCQGSEPREGESTHMQLPNPCIIVCSGNLLVVPSSLLHCINRVWDFSRPIGKEKHYLEILAPVCHRFLLRHGVYLGKETTVLKKRSPTHPLTSQ